MGKNRGEGQCEVAAAPSQGTADFVVVQRWGLYSTPTPLDRPPFLSCVSIVDITHTANSPLSAKKNKEGGAGRRLDRWWGGGQRWPDLPLFGKSPFVFLAALIIAQLTRIRGRRWKEKEESDVEIAGDGERPMTPLHLRHHSRPLTSFSRNFLTKLLLEANASSNGWHGYTCSNPQVPHSHSFLKKYTKFILLKTSFRLGP